MVRWHRQEGAELIFKSRLDLQFPTQVPAPPPAPSPTPPCWARCLIRVLIKCPKAGRLWNEMQKAGGKREPSSVGDPEGGSEGSVPRLRSVPIWLQAALTSQEDVPRSRDWGGSCTGARRGTHGPHPTQGLARLCSGWRRSAEATHLQQGPVCGEPDSRPRLQGVAVLLPAQHGRRRGLAPALQGH